MLQKELYAVFTKPMGSLELMKENVPQHLRHQREIKRQGILVAAVYQRKTEHGWILIAAEPQMAGDEKHWEGEGMFVIRALSIDHARQLAAADPMHQSGARSFSVRPCLVNEGRLNIQIDFSTGKMTLD